MTFSHRALPIERHTADSGRTVRGTFPIIKKDHLRKLHASKLRPNGRADGALICLDLAGCRRCFSRAWALATPVMSDQPTVRSVNGKGRTSTVKLSPNLVMLLVYSGSTGRTAIVA